MNKTRRVAALVLAMVMAFGLLAGCSSNSSTPATSAPATSAPAANAPATTAPAASTSNEKDPRTYHIATGALGAYNYTLYAGVSDLIEKQFPGKYTISLDAATGSTEMGRLMAMGDADFGTCSLDDVIHCYDGVEEFEGLPAGEVRFLYNTGGYGSGPTCHLFVGPKSPIEKLSDLAGKKVGVTSGYMDKYMRYMFECAGVDVNTMTVSYLSIADICNGIKDETLDAGFYASPHPLTTITDLAVTSGMKLIDVGEDVVAKIIEKYPFMHKVVIPAGTYAGNDKDIVTYTAFTCWICRADVPEQTVYDWLTVILADSDRLGEIHPNAKNIMLETALIDQNIPLHPGALKYYQEKGLITADPCADVKPAK